MSSVGSIEIGAASREHLGGVAALAAGALREAWSESGFAGMLSVPGAVCLVAHGPEAVLAGFLVSQRVLDELHVFSLAVAPAWRRRGVARGLIAAAVGDPPVQHVLLEVRPSNAAARRFYRALGFEEVGRRRGYYPDGEDALLLTRGPALPGRSSAVAGGRGA